MKMKRPFFTLAGSLLLWGFTHLSQAAETDTQSFQVKLTVTSACDIHTAAARDVDFGSHKSTETDITAEGGLTVNCTNGTPYDIGLDNGSNFGDGQRKMKSAATGELVGYELFRDTARSQTWGSNAGENTLHATGTGANENVPVYGKVIIAGSNLKAGDYIDAVTATVTY